MTDGTTISIMPVISGDIRYTAKALPTIYIIDCGKCGSDSINDSAVPCPPADRPAHLAKHRKMEDMRTIYVPAM